MAGDVSANGVADHGAAQSGPDDFAHRAVVEIPHHATQATPSTCPGPGRSFPRRPGGFSGPGSGFKQTCNFG
jgi:hypothetical protein